MSNRYFTSDLHLGSTNILKYAKRPFSSAEDAVVKLCQNANAKASYADILIHVGDFMLAKSDKHDAIEDIGLNYKKEDYLAMLKSRVFLLAGNHDDHNACEPDAKNMMIDLNKHYCNVFVTHFPSDIEDTEAKFHADKDRGYRYHGPTGRAGRVQINLCGHVHNAWLFHWDAKRGVLNVNVGVDVWNYAPAFDGDIIRALDYLMQFARFDDPENWSLTRHDFERYKVSYHQSIVDARRTRAKEKLAKKGLTKAECERRKIEAMKKRGRI